MPTQVQSIIRQVVRKPQDKLNVLTFPGDTHYDSSLCETGHNFYSIPIPNSKTWDAAYPIPKNYHIIQIVGNEAVLPLHIDFDAIIAHDRIMHYQVAMQLSQSYQLPVILVEHMFPPAEWGDSRILPLRMREGKTNVFIADSQRSSWGFDPSYKHTVNYTGINTMVFKPTGQERDEGILWFGNNILNKDEIFGFSTMRYITGFPLLTVKLKIIGDNQGLSKPAKNIDELVSAYNKANIMLNTKVNDPLPTNVLEAMACGCPVVSISVGDIPNFIKNGETGFVSNNPEQLKEYCSLLFSDKELARKIGENGRELIKKRFGLGRFVKIWQDIFNRTLEEKI